MSTPTAPAARSKTVRALIVFGAFAGIYIVSHFFRVSNAVIAPDMMRELTLSSEAMGILTGVFFASYAVTQVPVGMLIDRYGVRITIPTMMIIAVLGVLLFSFASGMVDLTLGRFLMGAGCSGILVGVMVIATRWFSPKNFTVVSGTMVAIGVFGNYLATTPFAAVVDNIGWRDSFFGMAGIAALAAIMGYLIIRDAPPGHAYHDRKIEEIREVFRGVGEVLTNPRLPAMFLIGFVSYACMLTILGLWGGPYLNDVHGLDIRERGEVLSIMTIALLLGNLAFAPLDRIFDTRKRVALAGAIATVAVLAVLALVPQPSLWLVTVLFALLGFLNGFAIVAFSHGRTIFPDRLVGRGLTMLALAPFLGVAVMQMVTGPILDAFVESNGLVSEAGYRWMFAFIAVTTLAAVTVYARTADAKPSLDPATRAS